MHGLVLTNKDLNPLKDTIIWCDSRTVEIGTKGYKQIVEKHCQQLILGSPGNFTASKLKWVMEYEPENYYPSTHMMLPEDFIAAKFSRVA